MSKEKIKIELHDYSYDCADRCCTNYGTITKVNGQELETHNTDRTTIIENILRHLGYEVEVEETYDYK